MGATTFDAAPRLSIVGDRLNTQSQDGNNRAGHTSPKPNHATRKYSKRRKAVRSLLSRSWFLPLAIMLATLSLYALNPTSSNIIHHFLFLSYKVDGNGDSPQYGKGLWDIAFVAFYTVFLSFTRDFIMHEILRPLARHLGIKSRGKQLRFTEQMYTAVYIAFAGPFGLYCMKQTPVWYFDTRAMYEGYPHTTHDAAFKFYYLFQAAFWAQQAVVMVLGVEKRRKDFKELIGHHIITITLIAASWRFHFAYIGIGVYITHDISDFFLAISKSLNYIDNSYQGHSFALCIAMWIYLRHYLNLQILYSLITEYPTVGPYELNWENEQFKCPLGNVLTFGLLAALQSLNLFWLYCLFRSAYKFVFLGIAKDDRSDDEASDVEVDAVEQANEGAVGMLENNLEAEKLSLASDTSGSARGTRTAAPRRRRG